MACTNLCFVRSHSFAMLSRLLNHWKQTPEMKNDCFQLRVGEHPQNVIQQNLKSRAHQATVIQSLFEAHTDLIKNIIKLNYYSQADEVPVLLFTRNIKRTRKFKISLLKKDRVNADVQSYGVQINKPSGPGIHYYTRIRKLKVGEDSQQVYMKLFIHQFSQQQPLLCALFPQEDKHNQEYISDDYQNTPNPVREIALNLSLSTSQQNLLLVRQKYFGELSKIACKIRSNQQGKNTFPSY